MRSQPKNERFNVGACGFLTLVLADGAGFMSERQEYRPGDLFVAASRSAVEFDAKAPLYQLGCMFGHPGR